MRNQFVAVVVAAGLLVLAAAASAGAHTTVCRINPEGGTGHCYALAVWHPEAGWAAEGSELKIDVITDDLPGAAEGDYFSDEMWIGFDSEAHWAETGVTGEGSPEELRYFWARQNSSGYEEQFPWGSENAPLNSWTNFKEQYEPGKCADCWGVWINNTGVQVDGGMEPKSYDLESGLEMTDTNIPNTFETTEPYWEDSGTWYASWVASGKGAHMHQKGPESPPKAYPNCIKEVDTDWAWFYGAKPCGQNGWEPSDAMPASPVGAQMGTASRPESPEQAALEWSAKSGDPAPAIEQTRQTVSAVNLGVEGSAGGTTTHIGDVFVLHGHFTVFRSVPPGKEPPTGSTMTLTINPEDDQVVREVLE